MTLKPITLACMGLFAVPAAALAQSNVTIYGTLNADVESVKAEGGSGPSFSSRSRVTSNSSNIGFKGAEDLSQGFAAIFQVESQVNIDAGTTTGFWASRNSGVGLRSNTYGQVLLGQWDSPYKYSTMRFDPTGSTGIAAYTGILGGTGTLTVGQGGSNFAERATFDRRVSNVVQYWTPAWNGLSGRFAYGASDTNIGSATGVPEGSGLKPALYSAAALYEGGNLYATLAYERHNDFQPLLRKAGTKPGRRARSTGFSTTR
jgi:predicted porin